MISAKIIADSFSSESHRTNQVYRITTFQLRYPKFIHGEVMTHRVFSRNASSSRAIPTEKYLEEVRSDELRACPVEWGKNQKGMQARELLTGTDLTEAQLAWRIAALNASDVAEDMNARGVHKQIVNRIMEPFVHINVVVTATEFMNFFGLRLHKDAQPEIRALATAMWSLYSDSNPRELLPGDWHLPYVWKEGGNEQVLNAILPPGVSTFTPQQQMLRMSVARCARVSYMSFDTGRESTIQEDLALYDRLLTAQPLHASPGEHQATPDEFLGHDWDGDPVWRNPKRHGNLQGFIQYRKTLTGEDMAPIPEEFSVEYAL